MQKEAFAESQSAAANQRLRRVKRTDCRGTKSSPERALQLASESLHQLQSFRHSSFQAQHHGSKYRVSPPRTWMNFMDFPVPGLVFPSPHVARPHRLPPERVAQVTMLSVLVLLLLGAFTLSRLPADVQRFCRDALSDRWVGRMHARENLLCGAKFLWSSINRLKHSDPQRVCHASSSALAV